MAARELVRAMTDILGRDKVLGGELERRLYSYDSSYHSGRNCFLPDIVVFPGSTEQVSDIIKYAGPRGIPVTPRGAGSGETCGCLAARGGIVLDLSQWDTIEEVDAANMQVLVRPGVVHARLNQHLQQYGLFFPPDPGSTRMCTLGGMVANNSSGLRAVKYGTTENYVLGLEVVLPDGRIIVTGGQKCRAIKNVSGLNLTKFFVGSEGTLGVITGIRLRVWPKPLSRGIAMAVFEDLDDAPLAVLDVYRAGILPSGIEILDNSAIRAVNMYRPEIDLPDAGTILLFEVDGNPPGVEWEGKQIAAISAKRASRVEWSTDPARMADLWQCRSVVAAAASRLRKDGTRIFAGEDISLPLNQVAPALKRIRALSRDYGIEVVSYGHIGDGNIHTAIVINLKDAHEVQRAERLVDEIHRLAIELGGATTGEHGVGLVRAKYAPAEHGPALDVMKQLKECLDPEGIMNPEKIFPPEQI